MHTHTLIYTHILISFEDGKLTGLNVDIANLNVAIILKCYFCFKPCLMVSIILLELYW